MKKYLILALFCAFITTMPLAAQDSVKVDCATCSHVAPVYMGEGGFIAMAEDDAEEVAWVVECGSVSMHGEMEPGDDGIVSGLFTAENGLACNDEDGGSFQLGPVTDGGWYWITGERSSAVGNLVDKDVLDNEPIDVVSAGMGVTMTDTKGAVLLTETSTGRTGILPTVIAEPFMEAEAPTLCGFTGAGSGTSPFKPRQSECRLGDGKTITLATITDGFTGDVRTVGDKAMVTRPRSSGEVDVVVDLWGNGTGHYVATHDAATANGITAVRGQPAVAMTDARGAARLTGVTYTVTRGAQGPGEGHTLPVSEAGTDTTPADPANPTDEEANNDDGLARSAEAGDLVTITITSDSDWCSKDNNYSANVVVTALMADATSANQIIPAVARNAQGVVGSTSFTVVCPAAAANMGQELVPENPFPTDK